MSARWRRLQALVALGSQAGKIPQFPWISALSMPPLKPSTIFVPERSVAG